MFIGFATNRAFGAPAERNVADDEFFAPYISLRWSEDPLERSSL
jgi:hypothetical protein